MLNITDHVVSISVLKRFNYTPPLEPRQALLMTAYSLRKKEHRGVLA